MEIIKYQKQEEEKIVKQVSLALLDEELVILPTDTVYGIGALATSDKAVSNLYKVKKRDRSKPTALLVASTKIAQKYLGNGVVGVLGEAFWPGPLTIVKEAQVKIAGMNKLGIRVPEEDFLLKVLEEVAQPVMASSANFAGEAAPVSFSQVSDELSKQVALAVDKGNTKLSAASTVIEIENSDIKILRPGPITKEQISEQLINEFSVND